MTPPPDPAILQRNLDALRSADPDLADRLAKLDVFAANPAPALTRDNRLSFRLTGPDGQTHWLGRTSVPGVRASALIEQFDPGQANVLLPGFGEGTEAEMLLQKLEPHRTVFVWESDPATVRLVLALRDYADAVGTGRLVILMCSNQELAPALSAWLNRHPTVQCPNRLMMWPWQTHVELAQCRSAVEVAWQESATRR
jgi:hypothetical protein